MHMSWWTLAIQGLNFLVLVWLLQRFLYRPVQKVIEKRKRMSLEDTALANKARREAEALKARYEQAMAGIEDERKAAQDKSQAALEAERARLLEEVRQIAEAGREKVRQEIAQDKSTALDALRKDVVGLATKMARALLIDIAPSIPNEAILSRLEFELARLDSEERRRLESEIGANGAAVEVVTARPLLETDERSWRARIARALDHDLDITFSHDPDLVAGAELRFPHTLIRATWSDQLDQASEALQRGGREPLL